MILSEPAPIHVDFYNHIKTATEELIGNIQELQRQITDLQDFLGYSYDGPKYKHLQKYQTANLQRLQDKYKSSHLHQGKDLI